MEQDVAAYSGIRKLLQGNMEKLVDKPFDLKEIERNALLDALHKEGGNISRVAKTLNVARNTVYRKLKQYNINPSGFRGEES